MAATPPPDWQRVPGASRAHLLVNAAQNDNSSNGKPPGRFKKFLSKPLVWALALVLGAIGAFVTNYVTKSLETVVVDTFTDPILLYDVHQLEPVGRDESGFVVPGSHSDLEAVEWDPGFGSAEDGGIPTASWAYEQGGTSAGWGTWEVVLEATRETEITIVDIRPENIECAAPASGTLFIFGSQGGEAPMQLGTTIDAALPEFKVLPEDWNLLPDSEPDQTLMTFPAYGDTTQLSLAPGDQEVVRFFAHAASQSCTWDVALEYATGGEYQTAVLSPTGENAFALAALLPPEQYDTVVIPYTYCEDLEGHAVTGEEAARIIEEAHSDDFKADCG